MPTNLPQPASGSQTPSTGGADPNRPSPEAQAIAVLLNPYPAYGTAHERAVERGVWLRSLRHFGAETLLRAHERYQMNGPRDPRDGRIIRPTIKDIADRCASIRRSERLRSAPALPKPPEPPRGPRVTAEQTAAIMAEIGFDPDPPEPEDEPLTFPRGTPEALRAAHAASQVTHDALRAAKLVELDDAPE